MSSDLEPKRPSIDKSTNVLNIIDYAHHETHAGSHFHTSAYDVDLDTDDELSFSFKTPNTGKWFHVIPIVSNSSNSLFEILEAPTITVDTGTTQDVINKNRNSTKQSGALSIETVPVANKVSKNATITADGIVLSQELIGSGRRGGQEASRSLQEIILKPDTIYAFRLTGIAIDGEASMKLVWYEHTNKN